MSQTERDRVMNQLVEAELRHAAAVRAWEAAAQPYQAAAAQNDEWFALTGDVQFRKRAAVARRNLEGLGPRPVEPLGIGLLKGRLHRLEGATA